MNLLLIWRYAIKQDELFAESTAAIVSDLFAYPLHTLWTAQQAYNGQQSVKLRHVFQKTLECGSIFNTYYKGFSISAAACIPSTFLYLTGAKLAIELFGNNNFGQCMQGPFAQAFSTTINAPALLFIELTQASTTTSKNNTDFFNAFSLKNKIKYIWERENIRGIYRGALPHFLIYSFSDALGFWLRAKIINSYPEERRRQIQPQLFSTLLGFSLAYAALTPLSVIETRIRIHETNPTNFPDKKFIPAMRTLYKQKGIRGFFTGTTLSASYGMVSYLPVAISGVYEL